MPSIDPGDPRFTGELQLADGRVIRLRPLVPDDDPAYREFAAGLSPESVYYRFFSPRSTLTEREIDHFLHVDYVDRFAVAALDGERVVGIGRYDRPRHAANDAGADADDGADGATLVINAVEGVDGTNDAELAFVVADDYQGLGIAAEMLRVLARAARDNGIERFVAFVLPDNQKMLHVFAQSGWVVDRHFEDGVIAIALAITRSSA